MSIEFKLLKSQNHIGHCQLTYKTKNSNNEKIYYCLQDQGENFGGIRLMRCTQDGEPSHECAIKKELSPVFERPRPDQYDSDYTLKLKSLCNEWIAKIEND